MSRPRRPKDVVLEHTSFFRAARLSRLTTRTRDRQAAKIGLRAEEWRILLALNEFGPMASIRLAEMTFMDRGAVSKTVARLEASGQISRTASVTDRRVAIVGLTDEGSRIATWISDYMRTREVRLMQVLSDSEFAAWLRITTKLHERMQELDQEEQDG